MIGGTVLFCSTVAKLCRSFFRGTLNGYGSGCGGANLGKAQGLGQQHRKTGFPVV